MRSILLVVVVALLNSLGAGQTAATRSKDGEKSMASESPLSSDLEWHDRRGKVVHLSEFRGKPVILNFWATWCPPCTHELPWLVAIQKKFGSRGLQVVGISMDDADDPAVAKVIAEAGINYAILFGPLESLTNLGAQGLPLTLYNGKEGRLRRKVLGIASYQELEMNVQYLLDDRGAAHIQEER
jgi:thiol-disulfide isomerase/thioredoxin